MADHPYPGLRPFLPNEFDIFFGRDEQLDVLVDKLGQSKFLAILGASGCGKSSLVNVGFLSTLHAGFYHGFHWKIANFRPGNAPFARLTEALQKDTPLSGENLGKRLRQERNLNKLLEETPLPENHNLLILVDQFEELFRYDQRPGEIEEFITWLLQSCQHDKVFVAIAMRLEFTDKCFEYRPLAEALNHGAFFIPNLNQKQLREAIENPAKVFGGQVEPKLVERLLKDLEGRNDKLPLMQHALLCLWPQSTTNVKLTLENYEKTGGIDALVQTAEDAFTELKLEEQKIAEILLRNLTAHDQETGQHVRNPLTMKEVGKLADVTWQAITPIVEAFRKQRRRFLTPMPEQQERLTADTLIDISHEAFIRQWPRLLRWAEDEKNLAKNYRRLAGKALHHSKGESELWRGRDLTNTLAWHENIRKIYPTDNQLRTWANRRAKHLDDLDHFDKAIAFLKASQEAEEQAKKLADKKRLEDSQREQDLQKSRENLRKTRLFWLGTGVLLVITIITAMWGFWESNQAVEAKQQIEQLEQIRTQDLFDSQRTHAALLAKVGEDYAAAQQLLGKNRELDKDIPAESRHARDLLANLTHLMSGTAEKTFENAGAPLYTIAVSSNQQWLAAAGENGTLVLFDRHNGKIVKRLSGLTAYVRTLVFDPNYQWLISGDDNGQVIQWSLPDGTQKPLTQLEKPIWTLAVSPDGKRLAIGGESSDITLWSLEQNAVENTLKGHEGSISALTFDADGKRLASGSYDKTIRLWQVDNGQLLHKFTGHTDRVQNVLFHPEGKRLVSSSSDKTIRLWDIDLEQTLRSLSGHKNTVFGLSFVTPSLLASSSADKTVRLWDVESGVTVGVLQGHTAQVTSLTAQGQQLWSASNDGSVKQWSTTLPQQHRISVADSATATAIAPDGKSVIFGFDNGRLEHRALPDLTLLWTESAHQRDVQRLAFNTNGGLLASVSLDKTVKIWQIGDKGIQLLRTVNKHQAGVNGVTFSADSQYVVTASYDKSIGIFTVNGENDHLMSNAHEGAEVNSVVFAHNGQQLLSASDKDVRWWDFKQGKLELLKTFPKEQEILWATVSPDNQWYARTTRNMSRVAVYQMSDGQKLYELPGHENSVWRAFFSPDNRQLITASSDATVRFWDLTKDGGSELFTLYLPTPPKTIYDFDFRCTPTCWLAIPTEKQVIVYELGKLYN